MLAGHAPDDRWATQPFARIKQIQRKIGAVGQEFVERLCAEIGFACEFPVTADGRRTRMNPWDIRIEGKTFEIKTATEEPSSSTTSAITATTKRCSVSE